MEKLFNFPKATHLPNKLLLSTSNSSSLLTIRNATTTASRHSSVSSSSNQAQNLLVNPTQSKRVTRKSESECDSQYFSGPDTSLVYADSSNYSTESCSVYSNYSVPMSAAAFSEVSKMAASLAQSPPSPPPPKSFSKLLNVASAAYQL